MPVTATHRHYDRHLPDWQTCRHVIAGERAVKDKEFRERYVPPLEGHKGRVARYERYVEGAHLYNAAGRTFEGLRGLIERNDPDVQAPDAMQPFVDDATGTGVAAGISVAEFAMMTVDEVLKTGRAGILTDFSAGSMRGATQREADRAGRRVFWSLWTAESIRKWWTLRVDGAEVLVKLVLEEEVDEEGKDEFETSVVTRYKVLDLMPEPNGSGGVTLGNYRQRVFVRKKTGSGDAREARWTQEGEDVFPKMDGAPLKTIPWVFVNARSTGAEPGKPPLLDLCNLNVKHLRNSASLEHGLLLAGSPTPWVTGYDPSKEELDADGERREPTAGEDSLFLMGGGSVWTFKEKDAKVGLLSIKSEDLGGIEQAMGRKEEQMVVIGARILSPDRGEAESGRAKEVDLERESTSLTTISKMCSKGLTRALEWARDWDGQSKDDVSVTLNTDFFGHPLTPQEAETIVRLWQENRAFAKADARRLLRRGEWIDAERDDETIDRELEQEVLPGFPPGPAPDREPLDE